MKPFHTLLASIFTTVGLAAAASAQTPSQGGYPPGYINPGQMPNPGYVNLGQMPPPGYVNPGQMPSPGYGNPGQMPPAYGNAGQMPMPPAYGNAGQMPYPPGYGGPGCVPPQYMGGMPPESGAPGAGAENCKYGWHPALKGLFTKRNSGDCEGGNSGAGSHHGLFSKKVPPPPPATGGTLAFPNHQFVRSPRDWFMQD